MSFIEINSTKCFPNKVILPLIKVQFVLLFTWILRYLITYLLNSKYDLISSEFNIPVVIIDIETAKPAILK